MTNDYPTGAFLRGLVVVFIVLGFGVAMGALGQTRIWGSVRTQAIEHGCAQYNPTTGKFEWTTKGEEP